MMWAFNLIIVSFVFFTFIQISGFFLGTSPFLGASASQLWHASQVHTYIFVMLLMPFLMTYSLGSISFGLLGKKLFKTVDPRTIGSGNIGATNMLRTGNKKAALFTLVGDFLKGFLLCYYMLGNHFSLHHSFPIKAFEMLSGYASILGSMWLLIPVIAHIYPIWTNFKGGKGIATAFGVLTAFSWPIGLICIALWLTVFTVTRVSSIAGLVFSIAAPSICIIVYGFEYSVWVLFLTALLIYTHQGNIIKLIKGEEHRFKRVDNSPGDPS